MRNVFTGEEVVLHKFGANDLWEYSDAIIDWCRDADGKGRVFVRFMDLPAFIDPALWRFIDNMKQAGVEVIITVRLYPPSNLYPMAHLSLAALAARLEAIAKWLTANFPGLRWCLDAESYDGTPWKKCEPVGWAPEVIDMLRSEFYAKAVAQTGVMAHFGMPHMSTNAGKLSYAMDPLATVLIGWFFRYPTKRPRGSTAAWQPTVPLTVVDAQGKGNIPASFAMDRVKMEAFYVSSDDRVIAMNGASFEYQTYSINDSRIANSAGREVWVYTDQTTDDLTTVLRQAK